MMLWCVSKDGLIGRISLHHHPKIHPPLSSKCESAGETVVCNVGSGPPDHVFSCNLQPFLCLVIALSFPSYGILLLSPLDPNTS